LIRVVAGKNAVGETVLEEVPAYRCGLSRFRLAGSPGLAQGAAAGDEIELRDDGTFEVAERGGNLAIQVLTGQAFDAPSIGDLAAQLEELGGRLDGGHGGRLRVFTVPVSAGFDAIETVMDAFVERHREVEWYFANVYDPLDGVTPLNWWSE
jgi:hypothetical protein